MKYKGFEIFASCSRRETWTVSSDGTLDEFDDEHDVETDDYFVSLPEENDGCVSMAELRADSIKELKKLINAHLKV